MKYIVCILSCFLFYSSIIAQTPNELQSWLPVIEGWNIVEEVEVFDADNLFDRINGAAPLFIENNFIEMTSLEYQKGDDYITIQAYRHATPEDAFGMYASERSLDLDFLPIGGEAQGNDKNIYFFAGDIYVKMWTNSTEDISQPLHIIASTLADKIDANAGYPKAVNAFPSENLISYSIAYITANYIGHEFLQSVYTAKYKVNDETIQAFIIDGKTVEGAKEVLNKYFSFTKQNEDIIEGELLIRDRYNGNIPVLWKGRYIIGLFNENGDPVDGYTSLIQQIAKKIS